MGDEQRYPPNTPVWVKLRKTWWACKTVDDYPPELTSRNKKPPLAVVLFFNENFYEVVKKESDIAEYECERKEEFIEKGLAFYKKNRKDDTDLEKFKAAVADAEKLCGGKETIIQDLEAAKTAAEEAAKAPTPPPPSPEPAPLETKTPATKGKKGSVAPAPTSLPPSNKKFVCDFCEFATDRVNGMVNHRKSHTVSTPPITAKPSPRPKVVSPPKQQVATTATPAVKRGRGRPPSVKAPPPSASPAKTPAPTPATGGRKRKSTKEAAVKKLDILADWNDEEEMDGEEEPDSPQPKEEPLDKVQAKKPRTNQDLSAAFEALKQRTSSPERQKRVESEEKMEMDEPTPVEVKEAETKPPPPVFATKTVIPAVERSEGKAKSPTPADDKKKPSPTRSSPSKEEGKKGNEEHVNEFEALLESTKPPQIQLDKKLEKGGGKPGILSQRGAKAPPPQPQKPINKHPIPTPVGGKAPTASELVAAAKSTATKTTSATIAPPPKPGAEPTPKAGTKVKVGTTPIPPLVSVDKGKVATTISGVSGVGVAKPGVPPAKPQVVYGKKTSGDTLKGGVALSTGPMSFADTLASLNKITPIPKRVPKHPPPQVAGKKTEVPPPQQQPERRKSGQGPETQPPPLVLATKSTPAVATTTLKPAEAPTSPTKSMPPATTPTKPTATVKPSSKDEGPTLGKDEEPLNPQTLQGTLKSTPGEKSEGTMGSGTPAAEPNVVQKVVHLLPVENEDGTVTYMLIQLEDQADLRVDSVTGTQGPTQAAESIFIDEPTNLQRVFPAIVKPQTGAGTPTTTTGQNNQSPTSKPIQQSSSRVQMGGAKLQMGGQSGKEGGEPPKESTPVPVEDSQQQQQQQYYAGDGEQQVQLQGEGGEALEFGDNQIYVMQEDGTLIDPVALGLDIQQFMQH